MAKPEGSRLSVHELEARNAPAVLSYTAVAGNGPDVLTVQLSSNGNKLQILDDGDVVASKNLTSTDSVVVTASSAEGDSLLVNYSIGGFPQPVNFYGGASGAAATVINSSGSIAINLNGSAKAVDATIGTSTTSVAFSSGGGVSAAGKVTNLTGTAFGDIVTDGTTIAQLTLDGGLGDDLYRLIPGSSIGITDAGGNDRLDFGGNYQSVIVDLGTTFSFVSDVDGDVTFAGTLENVVGTSEADTFTDNTTAPLVSLDGGLGDDLYRLKPGSSIGITDAGGNDRLDFGGNDQSVVVDLGTTFSFVSDVDGDVTFAGTLENVVGTSKADTFTDNTTVPLVSLDGGLGDDLYRLKPGSSIGITDAGGNDRLDFGGNDQSVVVDLGTTFSFVSDVDGDVTFAGTLENVVGTSQDDSFHDGGDVDYDITGGPGSDRYDLQPGSTIHIFESGSDKDTIVLGRAKHAVNANLTTGVITDDQGNQVLIAGGLVENLDGTAFPDVIVGNAADNTLYGGAGNDVLNGGAGNDLYIIVPGGNDSIIDSDGLDTIDFSQTTTSGVNVDLSRTNGSSQNISPGATLSLLGAIERAIGTPQADVLTGSSTNDVLVGLGGNDRLQGQSGNDILLGGAGADDLNGGNDGDILVGGAGADRLNAGSGEDILIAGSTLYDATTVDLTAWSVIHGIWVGPGSVATRVAAIRAGVGPTNQYRLLATGANQTVFDDGDADVLTGSQSSDWYFAQVPGNDTITDNDNQEYLNDLP